MRTSTQAQRDYSHFLNNENKKRDINEKREIKLCEIEKEFSTQQVCIFTFQYWTAYCLYERFEDEIFLCEKFERDETER